MTERTSQIFDQYVRDYDQALQQGLSVSGHGREYFATGRISYLARLLEQLDPAWPIDSVLDFGCGAGTSAPLLHAAFRPTRLLGVDPSKQSIEAAWAGLSDTGAGFAVLDDYRPAGDFALCYTNGVFHHIAPEDRPEEAELVFASLAPGGKPLGVAGSRCRLHSRSRGPSRSAGPGRAAPAAAPGRRSGRPRNAPGRGRSR